MRKGIVALILVVVLLLSLCACTKTGKDSTFSIQFIDVGQGDSALVECDGHYMLIDGGETTAGDKVYGVLVDKGIQRLDYLVISHLHTDHYGGLIKALTYASSIGKTLANTDYSDNSRFRSLEHQLAINGTSISVPHVGDKFTLGSAEIEVIDVASEDANDSLVLLITYGDTRFLFTGDIEYWAQTRISDKYQNEKDASFPITLMKLPHHGSYNGALYRFLWTFMPEYVIISVGTGNPYGHPHRETIDMLNSKTWTPKVYRTDQNGDIVVRSDGKTLTVETSR
ncbi:MAG: MBL fold metallo-hydrolase [Oscillospiraceae bacterium]|nr:MBL fold metallo-hydrolase [Oscillospiraceae bacterium]